MFDLYLNILDHAVLSRRANPPNRAALINSIGLVNI